MTTDDEQPEVGDQRETECRSEPRKRTQRLERHANPFLAPMTLSPSCRGYPECPG